MLWCVIIRACMCVYLRFIHSVCAIRADSFGANGGVRGSKACPMFLAEALFDLVLIIILFSMSIPSCYSLRKVSVVFWSLSSEETSGVA